jgi:hypothetical protein
MRNVDRVSTSGILERNTAFYKTQLPILSGDRYERAKERDAWLNGAIKRTTECEIVLLDPDNGLAPKSDERDDKTSRKHVFLQELVPFILRNQSLVIYHHLGRNTTGKKQIHDRLRELGKLQKASKPFALWYHAGTARAYFILPSKRDQSLLLKRAQLVTQSCKGLFDLYST